MNGMKLKISAALLLSCALCLIPFTAYAELMNLRGVEVSGDVGESISYNSNPGYSSTTEEGHDFANLMNFDLNVGVPFNNLHRYTINTWTNWYQYFNNQKYSQVNLRLAQAVDLIFNKAAFNLHHSYEHSSIPTIEEAGIISNGILKKDVNKFGFAMSNDLGKMKTETGFDMEIYRANDLYTPLDRNTYAPYVDLAYELTPVLDGYTRYTYQRADRLASIMNDSNQHDIVAGLRGEISKYLVGQVGAGFTAMVFDQKGDSSIQNDNYYGLNFNGSLTNRLTKYTSQKIAASYGPELGYNVGNFYKNFNVTYTLTHKLNRWITVSGLVEYENMLDSSGQNVNEDIDLFGYGAHVDWLLAKDLSWRSDFKYGEKDSNQAGNSYKQVIVQSGLFYTF